MSKEPSSRSSPERSDCFRRGVVPGSSRSILCSFGTSRDRRRWFTSVSTQLDIPFVCSTTLQTGPKQYSRCPPQRTRHGRKRPNHTVAYNSVVFALVFTTAAAFRTEEREHDHVLGPNCFLIAARAVGRRGRKR